MKTKTKKSGNNAEVIETNESQVQVTPEVTVTEPKKLGRPVDPNSARQLKLANSTNSNGKPATLGRPVVAGSKRQLKMQEIAAKKAAGIEGKRGRPVMTDEEKQAAREKRAAQIKAWEESQAASQEN